MTKEWINRYYGKLLPHYKNICTNEDLVRVNEKKPLSVFCTQWGERYPQATNDGILFIGRATNGWGGGFNANAPLAEGVFNSPNQMKWVDDVWSKPEAKHSWTANKSPFWRVIRKVTEHFHPENWYQHIAWSNLCKVSYEKSGNPSDRVFYAAYDDAKAILKSDIEMLSPKVIVMITGFQGWGSLFIEDIVGKAAPRKLPCSSGYAALFQGNGNNVIIIDRPESRKEWPFVQAITTAIESLKN